MDRDTVPLRMIAFGVCALPGFIGGLDEGMVVDPGSLEPKSSCLHLGLVGAAAGGIMGLLGATWLARISGRPR
jgi:hypothetical protein